MRAFRPPHLERLRRRVETLDAPAVQLWAWPGSGQQAVLDALVAEGGAVAQPLSVEDLAEEGSLRRAVEGAVAGSAPWLVLPAVPAPPRGAARTVAALLPAGRRLLFAAPERHPEMPLATAYVGPREHLLTGGEAAALWSDVTGRTPSPVLLAAAMAATDGWFRPLLLLAEAAAEGRGLEDGALAAIPAADSFLRHEVLPGLPPAERALARRLALAGSADPELWDDLLDADERAALERLRAQWGLLIPVAEGGERLPAPLEALLEAEAWREPRAAATAVALAAAERRRGRPAAALRLLAGAAAAPGESKAREAAVEALAELIASDWSRLLVTAPLSLLAVAAARLAGTGSPAADLVRRLIRGLDAPAAGRPAAPERIEGGPDADGGLRGFARETEAAEPGVAAAARVAAILLGTPSHEGEPADVGEDRAAEPAALAALPAALQPLGALAAALGEEPGPAEEDEEADDEDGEEDLHDGSAALALAALLAAVAPPPAAEAPDLLHRGHPGEPAPGADPRRPDRGLTAAAALAAAGLARLAHRRPALGEALRRRADLAPVWRDRLEAPAPPEPAGRGYELDLFGEGRVRRREPGPLGEPGPLRELSWPLKRALKVLAYLATAPAWRALRTDLEEELWPGADPGRLRRNFHPTLSHLRRSLEEGLGEPWPPPLLLAGGFYRLNPALAWRVDAAELERLALEGRRSFERERHGRAVACWEAVRDLYRGPLLAGWDDPWIAARREHYQRLWLESLRGLGESHLRSGRLEEAMDALRTVLIHDPHQERVHIGLMEVYSRQGRRDLVRRQHDRLVDLLSRDLGVELAPATKDAYQRLMA